MFRNRKLLIATKHKKEKVITPLLEKELGIKCFVSKIFDTDLFGTFAGKVQRKNAPVVTAINKCLMAMEKENSDWAVASEGSFGLHPFLFFVPADDEILHFIDKKNSLEIIARELSTNTNFHEEEIKTEKELKYFVRRAKFPSHRLIVRRAKENFTKIVKGITNWKELKANFHSFIEKYCTAFIETDMRAMYNPNRMKAIEKAIKKLTAKIKSCCPQCNAPDFVVTDGKQGLPCKECGAPTHSVLSHIYTCQKCSFTKKEMYPNKKWLKTQCIVMCAIPKFSKWKSQHLS